MIKTNPIIAVKDVEHSSKWYRLLFGCRSMHGGNKFDILVVENDEVLQCLHQWGEDEQPTIMDQNITPGNGLMLYFRTKKVNIIWENAEKIGSSIEEDLRVNQNTNPMEFSLRDPDGYYITVTEFHNYEGQY